MDCLTHKRIGAGNHCLAGDDRGRGCQHDHRIQQRRRDEPVERALDRGRIGKQSCSLAEIIYQQRWENEKKPRQLDGLAAKVTEIGIKRLATSDGEKHQTQCNKADMAVLHQKGQSIARIDGA